MYLYKLRSKDSTSAYKALLRRDEMLKDAREGRILADFTTGEKGPIFNVSVTHRGDCAINPQKDMMTMKNVYKGR
ncbi:hypothetical protein Ct61P_05861 [Colletotrichum tofieldiae]|nr:hypothetical protein Ct61P_05861 [Colletotrichum tofieldiae]